MLDINYIKENREFIIEVVKNKKVEIDIDFLLSIYEQRQTLLKQIENLRADKNDIAEQMKLISNLSGNEKQSLIQKGKEIKDELQKIEEAFLKIDENYKELMYKVPNIYSEDTPIGLSEDENVVIRQVGAKPEFSFTPLEHWQLGKNLDLIDTEKSAEVSGSRFAYLKGDLVLLQFALIQWVMSVLQNSNNIQDIAYRSGLGNISYKNYTPVITYVYNSCKISQDCLEIMKKNNYKEPNNLIGLYQNDIINKDSYDSMGACVYFKDGRVFWCGSVLTNKETMKLLGKNCKSNCTQLQVSICVLSNIEYLLKHKNEGVITNEDLPFKKQIEYCKPYWGLYVCREITNDVKNII